MASLVAEKKTMKKPKTLKKLSDSGQITRLIVTAKTERVTTSA
jgi:hypothetical protein